MKAQDALAKMKNKVESVIERFSPYPLFIGIDEFYSDLRLTPVKFEKANYINVTLVIATRDPDDDEAGAEYRIGIGAEVKHGKVDEAELEASFCDFLARVDECINELESSDTADEAIATLDKRAEEEYERLSQEIEERAKKMRPLYVLGMLLIVIGAFILFFFAARS